jgi:hypothetical protein
LHFVKWLVEPLGRRTNLSILFSGYEFFPRPRHDALRLFVIVFLKTAASQGAAVVGSASPRA